MNVGRFLVDAAERNPERLAFAQGGSRLDYCHAAIRAGALAAALSELGCPPGDTRVGLMMWNCPELVEAMFGVWQAGGAIVPLNARFVADEVAYQLNDVRARVLIYGEAFGPLVDAVRPRLETVEHFITVGARRPHTITYEDVVGTATSNPLLVDRKDGDLAWVFYTSGTTGRPKGAMLSHANLVSASLGWVADLHRIEPEDVGLHAAPLSHGAGFHSLALTMKGATQVLLESRSFRPREFVESVERERVTNTWLVPTQIMMLLNSPEFDRADISSLRSIVYGGAPIQSAGLRRAIERAGRVFVQLYGQGETPMTATYLRAEDHVLDGPLSRRLASCGHARSGVEIEVRDGAAEVPRGEVGEICVRGSTVMSGYWDRPDATAETLRNGWLYTGDVGYQDEHGYIYLLDRSKDVIISGGANVYPREVEEILALHSEVSEVCVIGIPDQLWGEAVLAVVVPRSMASPPPESALIAFAAERMAGYKKPKAIRFVHELPKSAYGKLLRRELQAAHSVSAGE